MDIGPRIKEILEQTFVMSLGTADEQGVWVADVTFVFDEHFNLYWMSHPQTRHSQAIENNKKVAATITVTISPAEKGLGIQIDGEAEKLEGSNDELCNKLLAKKNQIPPKEGEDFMKGRYWYILRPSQILLIDEANYGFKRQLWKVK